MDFAKLVFFRTFANTCFSNVNLYFDRNTFFDRFEYSLENLLSFFSKCHCQQSLATRKTVNKFQQSQSDRPNPCQYSLVLLLKQKSILMFKIFPRFNLQQHRRSLYYLYICTKKDQHDSAPRLFLSYLTKCSFSYPCICQDGYFCAKIIFTNTTFSFCF